MDHVSDLEERIGKLLFDERSSDVILKVGDERFPAHKAILAVSCDHFRYSLFRRLLGKNEQTRKRDRGKLLNAAPAA